jgi:hypothetical protein
MQLTKALREAEKELEALKKAHELARAEADSASARARHLEEAAHAAASADEVEGTTCLQLCFSCGALQAQPKGCTVFVLYKP